jgi:nucleoside-diphosphate-sugar epimerase
MNTAVIGGTGRVGTNVVRRLLAPGHDAMPAALATGVDTITGEGIAEVTAGADTAVDVAGPPAGRERRSRPHCRANLRLDNGEP